MRLGKQETGAAYLERVELGRDDSLDDVELGYPFLRRALLRSELVHLVLVLEQVAPAEAEDEEHRLRNRVEHAVLPWLTVAAIVSNTSTRAWRKLQSTCTTPSPPRVSMPLRNCLYLDVSADRATAKCSGAKVVTGG